MDRKPPLAVSPRRLRPRRPPTSLSSLQTPTAPKTSARPPLHFPSRHSIAVDSLLRPAHPLLPSEPKAIAKASKDDTLAGDNLTALKTSPLFERGRFYEVYSARRNERLKRKMAMDVTEETVAQYPEVAVELSKKRVMKKGETPRKSCPANFSVSRASSLRSSGIGFKETKKASVSGVSAKGLVDVGKRLGTRSALRKGVI